MSFVYFCYPAAYLTFWIVVVYTSGLGVPWVGVSAVVGYLFLHTLCFIRRFRIAYLLLFIVTFVYGWGVETCFTLLGALDYASDPFQQMGLAPVWVAVLYPLFFPSCSLFLRLLRPYLWGAALIGFVAGPFAYYSASFFGAVVFPSGVLFGVVVIGCGWALSFPLLLCLANTYSWYSSDLTEEKETLLFRYSSSFPVSIQTLFAWHESPEALSSLLPPGAMILKKGASLEVGEKVHIRFSFAWFCFNWIAEHTRYKKNLFFEDVQLKGPFRSWKHFHSFQSIGISETVLSDEVGFTLPFPLLTHPLFGSLVNALLHKSFAERHRILRVSIAEAAQSRSPLA